MGICPWYFPECYVRELGSRVPVDISNKVEMPQFEIFMVIPDNCQETFHISKQFEI